MLGKLSSMFRILVIDDDREILAMLKLLLEGAGYGVVLAENGLEGVEKFIEKTIPRGAIPNFPYLVPPKLISKPKSPFEMFGRKRRRIPTSSRSRFKR